MSHPYQALALLVGPAVVNSGELRACLRGSTPPASSPLAQELRRRLGLFTGDVGVRVAYSMLRLVGAVLPTQPRAIPAPVDVPPVPTIQGAVLEPTLGIPVLEASKQEVLLEFLTDVSARITGDGASEVVSARETNRMLTVAWPAWIRVSGILRLDTAWTEGSEVRIFFPAPSKAPDDLLVDVLAWGDLHVALQKADLADLFHAAQHPAYKLGYAAAALVKIEQL